MARRHAVCLTGLERSFAEIGGNIREGFLGALGDDALAIFGVRPPHDSWASIRALLPLSDDDGHLVVQQPCWSVHAENLTVRWMHCDMRLRKGDCRLSFLQAMCDLSRCEELIASHERATGWSFDVVWRLRADLFWEARLALPTRLAPDTVYVPAMDTQDVRACLTPTYIASEGTRIPRAPPISTSLRALCDTHTDHHTDSTCPPICATKLRE